MQLHAYDGYLTGSYSVRAFLLHESNEVWRMACSLEQQECMTQTRSIGALSYYLVLLLYQ